MTKEEKEREILAYAAIKLAYRDTLTMSCALTPRSLPHSTPSCAGSKRSSWSRQTSGDSAKRLSAAKCGG